MDTSFVTRFVYYSTGCLGVLGIIIVLGYVISGDANMAIRGVLYTALNGVVFFLVKKKYFS